MAAPEGSDGFHTVRCVCCVTARCNDDRMGSTRMRRHASIVLMRVLQRSQTYTGTMVAVAVFTYKSTDTGSERTIHTNLLGPL